jgi:hypothetical protein
MEPDAATRELQRQLRVGEGPDIHRLLPPYNLFPRATNITLLTTDERAREDIARFNVRRHLPPAEEAMFLSLDPHAQADAVIVHIHCAYLSTMKALHDSGNLLSANTQIDEAHSVVIQARSFFCGHILPASFEISAEAWVLLYGPFTNWDPQVLRQILTPQLPSRNAVKSVGNKAARKLIGNQPARRLR